MTPPPEYDCCDSEGTPKNNFSAAMPHTSSLLSRIGNSRWWFALGIFVLGVFSFLGWQHLYPVQAADGWSFRTFQDDIPMISAMLIDGRDTLYVSQEFRNEKGAIVRLHADGSRQEIVNKLSKPDGLALFQNGIAIAQEGGKHPVLWWRGGETRLLFSGDSIEGLASDGRDLFAIEDVKQNGRLLKYAPDTKETTTLRDGLEEGEGVTVCPDGRLFYTEKKKGWIKKFSPGNSDEVIARGLQAPSFLMCNIEGLWITEDLTHRARLLLLDTSGAMHTILSHLRSPQTILSIGKERLLVAEQGRGRILEVKRTPHAKQ
ncbi:hypothetical protein [Propionivibrio sp.]|jgi:hypothetical protein|uniref:hypothetical protein n=1 Tax=Propionivibrio sp. TaxID=2212460 RepID=UPI00272E4B25|nr:hypothetical protein [Propionivibrio sp.]